MVKNLVKPTYLRVLFCGKSKRFMRKKSCICRSFAVIKKLVKWVNLTGFWLAKFCCCLKSSPETYRKIRQFFGEKGYLKKGIFFGRLGAKGGKGVYRKNRHFRRV